MAFLMVSEADLIILRRVDLFFRCSRFHSTLAEDATDSIRSKRYSRPPASASLP